MNANTDADRPADLREQDAEELRQFEIGVAAAREICRWGYNDLAEFTDYAVPHHDRDGLVASLSWAMFPTYTVLDEATNSIKLDDEDGAAPKGPRTDRTFLFDEAFDEDEDDGTDLQFEVVAAFKNSYDDARIAVETPAPWDTPDELTAANDVVKSLPWGEDEAEDERDGAHYTFNSDDRDAPAAARNDVWVLDADYAEDLHEVAEAAGYAFVEPDARARQGTEVDEPDADREQIRELVEFVAEGDRVTVRYQKKNGSGRNEYAGEVTYHTTVRTDARDGYTQGTGETWGLVFEDDGGKTKRVKADDEGLAGLFSSGHYPFMGTVESVTVEVAEDDDE